MHIVTHDFREARSFFMDDADAGQDFTADIVLSIVDEDGTMLLDGTDANW